MSEQLSKCCGVQFVLSRNPLDWRNPSGEECQRCGRPMTESNIVPNPAKDPESKPTTDAQVKTVDTAQLMHFLAGMGLGVAQMNSVTALITKRERIAELRARIDELNEAQVVTKRSQIRLLKFQQQLKELESND